MYQIYAEDVLGSGQFGIVYGGKLLKQYSEICQLFGKNNLRIIINILTCWTLIHNFLTETFLYCDIFNRKTSKNK